MAAAANKEVTWLLVGSTLAERNSAANAQTFARQHDMWLSSSLPLRACVGGTRQLQ
jgi:hypothetical protein